jgi:GNAT superfamily N-acetyltransferase
VTARPAQPADVGRLARSLADAFDGDPVWRWLVPAGGRLDRLERFFALELSHVALPRGTAWTTDALDGAVLVLPPDGWRLPLTVQARHAPAYARTFGRRLPRALAFLTRMEAHHLREPHWYVAYAGVAGSAQGRGRGRTLLEAALERADADGLPAFLEASSPRSAVLYRRLGFEDLGEVRFAGSPPLTLMRRAPRA